MKRTRTWSKQGKGKTWKSPRGCSCLIRHCPTRHCPLPHWTACGRLPLEVEPGSPHLQLVGMVPGLGVLSDGACSLHNDEMWCWEPRQYKGPGSTAQLEAHIRQQRPDGSHDGAPGTVTIQLPLWLLEQLENMPTASYGGQEDAACRKGLKSASPQKLVSSCSQKPWRGICRD